MKSAMLSLVMCLASVHAIVDTDNCKCFKDAVHDAKAAALAAAGDHSGETHQGLSLLLYSSLSHREPCATESLHAHPRTHSPTHALTKTVVDCIMAR